ncbi:hypothetical protein J1N35_004402 [Gossypium stocksii]|uniref:Reverse transcriptase domain-containing protein n=1 Tax=Gossypium stocksii TaxID=47602 RepID=A0A9D3WBW4_9ROSI|nr:hypothetical protein J1N35_004402 [Gossypium stocksii]
MVTGAAIIPNVVVGGDAHEIFADSAGQIGSRGGLSLGWKGNSLITLRSYSPFHVDVDINDYENGASWRLTEFYGNPDERYRRRSWELLRQLGSVHPTPWLIFWDKFRSTNIRERLDRGVANSDWMNLFSSYSVEHLSHSISDHCPVLIDTLGKDPTDEVLEEIIEVQLGLNLEVDKNEVFWEQQAWVNWLKHGDRNTSFFYKVARSNHYCNRILGLEDEEGGWFSQTEEMLKIALKHFDELYIASIFDGEDCLLELVEQKVTMQMNDGLLKPFTEYEIWHGVKSMAPLKAPGTDGRHISDNVLIAYEILHSLKMKKSGKKGNFAFKLDMSKAYDRVEWDFLAGMMSRLGFHQDWVVIIMRCVCSVTFTVGINEGISDFFLQCGDCDKAIRLALICS